MNRGNGLLASLAALLFMHAIATLVWIPAAPQLLDDVASPYRWCDAADAYDARGESGKAEYAYRRAVVLESHEAPVLLRAANFELTRPGGGQALPQYARLLRLVPDYDDAIFSTYAGMHFEVAEVLQRGLPIDRRAGQSYFRILLERHPDTASLALTWNWLTVHGFREERLAGLYAAYLLGHHAYAEAAAMWRDFAGRPPPQDLVFNGSFESAPMASPLDWTIASEQVRRESGDAHGGRFALMIHFTGLENINFHHVWQSVVAGAGTYRLEAFVKTSGITTDEGLRLHLFDTEQPGRLDLWTESLTGTHPWTRIAREISIPKA